MTNTVPVLHSKLIRVRRLMIVGLIASTFGNSLIEAGFDSATAAGTIAVALLIIIKSVESIAVFFFPFYARVVSRFSPDTTLIFVDLTEAALSLLSIILITTNTASPSTVLPLFILIDSFLTPVSDIADEFYGASLAKVDEDVALGFNAFLYSAIATLGFVIGGPLGSYFAEASFVSLLSANVILSIGGAIFRQFARRQWAAQPLNDADEEDWKATGDKMPVRQFLQDLFLSGPASPILSLFIRISTALTGELFLLWSAREISSSNNNISVYQSMGIVLAVFGIAAAIGPLFARWVKQKTNVEFVLRFTAFGTALLILSFTLWINIFVTNSILILSMIFLLVVLNRIRLVVLETYRQATFTGNRFSRIMSWSYSFGAVGTLIGLQIGFFTNLVSNPSLALSIATTLWIFIGMIVSVPASYFKKNQAI